MSSSVTCILHRLATLRHLSDWVCLACHLLRFEMPIIIWFGVPIAKRTLLFYTAVYISNVHGPRFYFQDISLSKYKILY
jgi:hypothetical protein